jgi:hypothetical protein
VGMAVQVRLRPLSAADRERGDTGCVAVRSRLGPFPLRPVPA